MSSAQPIRLALTPSAKLAFLILGLHGAAALCILTVSTAWLYIAAALLVVALGWFAARDRALLRSVTAPVAIVIGSSGEAACLLANGQSVALEALGGIAVTRYWVALRLRSPRRQSLLVAAGMLPPESLRLLRLWALWGRLPAVAPRQLQAAS